MPSAPGGYFYAFWVLHFLGVANLSGDWGKKNPRLRTVYAVEAGVPSA